MCSRSLRRRCAFLVPAMPALCVIVLTLAACEREERELHRPPQAALLSASAEAGTSAAPAPYRTEHTPDERNAYDLAQGKQLYKWYNCNGCHAEGGGDKGPALMDDAWIYGARPSDVFTSIVQGRPNGMPGFGQHIPEYQVWQLVAYVRSMSGLAASDAATSRDDRMQSKIPENRVDAQPPRQAAVPAAEEPHK
jgi:cytochrome c oxidase cbb3-type subunit 3